MSGQYRSQSGLCPHGLILVNIPDLLVNRYQKPEYYLIRALSPNINHGLYFYQGLDFVSWSWFFLIRALTLPRNEQILPINSFIADITISISPITSTIQVYIPVSLNRKQSFPGHELGIRRGI